MSYGFNICHMVLGDNESGKTTLIAKLQGVEDPKKGSGLEFAYIDVRDDYRDGMKVLTSLIDLKLMIILTYNFSCRSYKAVCVGFGWRPGSRKSIEICTEQRKVSTHTCYVGRCHDHTMGHPRSASIMGSIIRRSY